MKKDKLTAKEQITIDYYDKNALDWSNKHGLVNPESYFYEDLLTFFKVLPKGKILEVGSGHGGHAIELIKHYGLSNYAGVDASNGLLEIARKRNPGAKFLNQSIYELDFPEESFDGFWVSAMLVHIPKSRLQEAFSNLKKILKPQGIGFISIMEGNLDMDESRPGRFFTLWGKEEFEKELKDGGFKILRTRTWDPGGNQSPWLAYIVQKL